MHRWHVGLVFCGAVCALLGTVGGPWGPMIWVRAGHDVGFAASYMLVFDDNPDTGMRYGVVDMECNHLKTQTQHFDNQCPHVDKHCKAAKALVPTTQVAVLILIGLVVGLAEPGQQTTYATIRAGAAAFTCVMCLGIVLTHVLDECLPAPIGTLQSKQATPQVHSYKLQVAPVVLTSAAALAFLLEAIILVLPADSPVIKRLNSYHNEKPI